MKSEEKVKKLIEYRHRLNLVLAADRIGEDFHDFYTENEKRLNSILKTERALYRGFKVYFTYFAASLSTSVNWSRYDLRKADEYDEMLDGIDWDYEIKAQLGILVESLVYALVEGGRSVTDETGVEADDWDNGTEYVTKFLRKYGLSLAKDLTDTTKDRIKEQLRLSIELGEDVYKAAERLENIIGDPKRAERIARTESVRTFTEGRLEVGRRIGANRKQWSATLRACDICNGLDGQIVGINELFSYGGRPFRAAPAHPNCRCLIRILLPEE